jgi:acid phosphatase
VAIPAYDHIFVIVMENHSYNEVIGAPYISTLSKQGAVGGSYFATDHPSLPNYAELTSGQSFPNAGSDCDPSPSCQSTARNIVDTVVASGRTWHSYQESMGSACGKVTSGQYAPKHNPFVYFTDISPASCQANVVDYSNLANDLRSSNLPNYVFITPNMCNDMHDCSIGTGDSWLSKNVPAILGSSAFTQQRSLLLLVWDEDDQSQSNQVALIAVGSKVKTGYVSSVRYTHYSLLKTIEAAWGLASLNGNDQGASAMTDLIAG